MNAPTEISAPARAPKFPSAPSPAARTSRWTPLWVLAIGAAALLYARLGQVAPWIIPTCGLHALTGLPCPFCGSTRSLVAWTHLDPLGALRWNPLVAVACVLLGGWCVLRLVESCCHSRWTERLRSKFKPVVVFWVVGGAAFVNWIYLMLYLPP